VTGDWIFDASEIIIESSADNKTFVPVVTEAVTDEHKDHWAEISSHKLSFEPVEARYFKVTVKPSLIPEWHAGKGNRAFIFVDEIRLD
ncbi:MAG: beta-N-acetylhexosaminidase, partial [Proteiniphilum sp.]|nr:beta-N-acetylhexosaminidase [Proteiniphilum sp.]